MKNKNESAAQVVARFKIRCRFADFVLCPANAIEDGFYKSDARYVVPEFDTDDCVICKPEFQTTWNNNGGAFEEELEQVSMVRFGVPFQSIRSIWIGRLGHIDDYWHLIKLERK